MALNTQGSVAALQKKTHRDQEELLAELERTKQWVHKREEGLYSTYCRHTVYTILIMLQNSGKRYVKQKLCYRLESRKETY